MWHILLVIFKFIGILLASILGLILFLVLLVLLAPFGYSAKGEAGKGKTYFQGKLSWLFAVVLCKVVYSENGLNWYIRIFGIPVAGNDDKFQQKKAKKLAKKAEKAKKSGKKKKTKEVSNAKKTDKKAEEPKALEKKPEQVKVDVLEAKQPEKMMQPKPEQTEPKVIEEIISEAEAKSFTDKLRGLWKKLTGFLKSIRQKILAIPNKIRQITDSLEEKKEKIDQILVFWREEATQDAKDVLIRDGKKMLLHILPGKFRGEIEFGLEDPYVMGQILAVLGMLMPLYQDKLKVQPDFEEQKFVGRFSLKGRIIPGYLVYKGLVLLLNKNIRKTIKEGKQLIGGN